MACRVQYEWTQEDPLCDEVRSGDETDEDFGTSMRPRTKTRPAFHDVLLLLFSCLIFVIMSVGRLEVNRVLQNEVGRHAKVGVRGGEDEREKREH